MREAYRVNQHLVNYLFDTKEFGLHGVFIANQPGIGFEDANKEIVDILNRLGKTLKAMISRTPGNANSRIATAEIKKN